MTEVFNMNKEEIIKLAREVGLLPDNLHPAPQTHHMAQKQKNLERFAALVAAAEREACAKVCDVLAVHPEYASDITKVAAQAIRARGKQCG
jgi:cupin superfamily acireductone dioxygenase involved in methionine salvage